MKILSNSDLYEIKKRRRRNYQYLMEHFREKNEYVQPFKELPPGVCPLFFPLIMKKDGKRDYFHGKMGKYGITTHDWWKRFHPDVPWSEFPDSVFLKNRLYGLPIHQDLNEQHLEFMIHKFEETESMYREES